MNKKKLMFVENHPLLFEKVGRVSYTYENLNFWDYIKYLPQIILYKMRGERCLRISR